MNKIFYLLITVIFLNLLVVSADLSQVRMYYDFNSTRELVSGVYNLTVNEGTVSYNSSSCRIGNCSQITPGNNMIIPGNNVMQFNGTYSLNFWIRPTNTDPAGDEFIFYTFTAGVGRISIRDASSWYYNSWFNPGINDIISSQPPQVNNYSMFTITRDGLNGNLTAYINSAVVGSTSLGSVNITNWQYINLGTNFNNGSDFIGQIDDLSWFDHQLTQGEINNLYNNASYPFTVTTPRISITSPSQNQTLASTSFPITINVTNNFTALSYCYFNITRGASVEIGNTQIINCINTTTMVSGDANYIINVFANDSNNDRNTSSNAFIVNTGGGGGGSSGGGGGGSTTIINNNGGSGEWSMKTSDGSAAYIINLLTNTERTKAILFQNLGSSSRKISLSCEDIDGELCSYVTFEESQFDLPLAKDISISKTFTVYLPKDLELSDYKFNIIARDVEGNEGVITVTANTNLNFFIKIGTKLISSKSFGETSIPYIFIFLGLWVLGGFLLNLTILKKSKGGGAISLILGLFISLAIIFFL